jgi:hypothetical protein
MGCASYHGAFWHILGKISKKMQPDCGTDLYCQGNIVIIFVTIGDF